MAVLLEAVPGDAGALGEEAPAHGPGVHAGHVAAGTVSTTFACVDVL